VLLCTAAARGDTVEEAMNLVDRGVELFKAGQLAAARESFARAQTLLPDKPNPYRWLGLVDARLGRCADAVRELDTFIAKVAADDPRTVEAITIRDRCKTELAPQVGALVVQSAPPGAEVRIDDLDGRPAGVTPFRADDVHVGSHVVALRLLRHVPLTRTITIARGETVRLDVTLAPEPPPTPPATPAPVHAPAPAEKKRSKAWVAGLVVPLALGLALGVAVGVLCGSGDCGQRAILPPVVQP
jgi:hypothetical protein